MKFPKPTEDPFGDSISVVQDVTTPRSPRTDLEDAREAIQGATDAMAWALPVILAVRAWRDHDYADGGRYTMRRGAELEQAILDAINDFDEYAALSEGLAAAPREETRNDP